MIVLDSVVFLANRRMARMGMIATRLCLLDVIRWMYRRTLGWLMLNVCKWEYGGKLTLTPCFRCSSQRQNVKGVNESERFTHNTMYFEIEARSTLLVGQLLGC